MGVVFILPRDDSATTVFSVDFPEEDALFARIACQEFMDVRRGSDVNSCVTCQFHESPPGDIAELNAPKVSVGFVSFTVFLKDVKTDARKLHVAKHVMGFRNYLYFHIKAAKTYLHQRVRGRVGNLLQVLNRAKRSRGKKDA